MGLTRLAIARPILIWMVLLAIALLGIRAYFSLPAELNPRVDIPTVTITTLYPGAGPPEVESQVSKPLEEAAGTAGGVKDVYSTSQPNVSVISMDFRVGTNLETAIAEVRQRIEAVRSTLPIESRPPVVAKLDINAQPILYIGFGSPTLSVQQLRHLTDSTIRPRLERVAGVASIQVIGGSEREIHVNVDGSKLVPLGLTIEDVVNALKASGRDIPGGNVRAGRQETEVRLSGAFGSLAAIRATQVFPSAAALSFMTPTANPGSALPAPPVTVGDVADVQDTTAERSTINRINGNEGVSLVLTKASDASTVTVVDGVNAALERLAPTLPKDLTRLVLRDDAETVRDALNDVNSTLVLGAVLAMTVILLFLHNLRGTLIVSLAIPACVVATFLVMGLAAFTLNQMTLLALSLSVGILVDDSVVVLESITRHLREGEPPFEAALNGRSEIGFADITTTLVDVVVFVPIAFMGGIVGGFFKQFGLCIATATLFSLVVSFTLTPMLAARWYRQGERLEAETGIFAPIERLYRRLEALYRRVIRIALRRRLLVILAALVALGLIFVVAFARLGFEFLPGTDQGQIAISIEMPPGTRLEATSEAAHRLEAIAAQKPEVQATATTIGQVLGGFGSLPKRGTQFAQINVRLKEKAGPLQRWFHLTKGLRLRGDEAITTALRAELQPLARTIGGRVTTAAIRSVIGISLPVNIEMHGDDVNRLTKFAERVRDELKTTPGVLDPDVSVRSGKPEILAQIVPGRAARFNVAPSVAGAIVRDSLAGNADAILRQGGDEYPIRVQLAQIQRDNVGDVGRIVVGYDAQAQPVRLSDVADIATRNGPANIERNNGQRMVSVVANLAPNTPLGNVQQAVQKRIDALPHEGIVVQWSGDAKTLDENAIPFASALILAILLVYIVMASLFNSLGTPFVIMFVLPMALVGALGALVLTGETMSLVAAIGIIMLVGLMGRNAILLLDYTNTLRGRGQERNTAIENAGATRLRPILMTTTATIIGMLPVALRIGKASEIRAPMAVAVIGGLLVSTLLTLVVIPVLYSLFDDVTRRFRPHTREQEILLP